MLMWFVRREFWDFLAWVKFRFAKPVDITLPPAERWYIEPKPMINAIPQIPLRNVAVCTRADIPKDERSLRDTLFFSAVVWLYTRWSPMQRNLPAIHEDPHVALKRAYRGLRRTLFDPPDMPAEYLGTPDLGSLAVRGPFACYTTKVKDSAEWEWNLLSLNDYDHNDGLMKIGSRVSFHLDKRRRALEAYHIECELGLITPTDPRVGPGLQDRIVRRLDAPFPCPPLQLGALGRRCTVGHRDAQSPAGRSPAVPAAMALYLRHSTEQRHGHSRTNGPRWRLRDDLQPQLQRHVRSVRHDLPAVSARRQRS